MQQTGAYKILNNFTLKWIAMLSMIVDHSFRALLLDATPLWAKIVGRLAFPIYCFLLVEGFHHTRDAKKYAMRLGIFAILSEIPFDLFLYGEWFRPDKQNVFFTLFLGVVLMYFLERDKDKDPLKGMIWFLLACAAAMLLRTDYSVTGIVIIYCFYEFRNSLTIRTVSIAGINLLSGLPQAYGALALIPVAMYNGKKGKNMKYFFYLFYPGHLLLLYYLKYKW